MTAFFSFLFFLFNVYRECYHRACTCVESIANVRPCSCVRVFVCVYVSFAGKYAYKKCQKLACDRIHNNVKAPPPSCKSKHISRSSTFNVQLIELVKKKEQEKKECLYVCVCMYVGSAQRKKKKRNTTTNVNT